MARIDRATTGAPVTADQTLATGAMPADDRRVALALHAMAPADRGWMLERLPASARGQLREWLDELESLGVPRDPSLLATARAALPARAQPAGSQAAMIASVAALTPEQVADVLRHEPVALAVALLGISDWPWRQSAIAMLGVSHARRVAEATMTMHASQSARPAPGRDAALMRAVLDRVAAAPRAQSPANQVLGAQGAGRARQHVAGLVALFSRKAAA